MSANREALRMMKVREPVELGECVTPERVVALALDVVDLGYRAHGENGRASLPAVQIDWMMQQWADAEERAATADRDASDYADAMDACMADAVEMERLRKENAWLSEAVAVARATNCDLHRRAQKAEAFRQRNSGVGYSLQRRIEAGRARRAAEAKCARLLIAFHDAIRRPLGVTPDSGAEFYDPQLADEAEDRRAGLKEQGGGSAA